MQCWVDYQMYIQGPISRRTHTRTHTFIYCAAVLLLTANQRASQSANLTWFNRSWHSYIPPTYLSISVIRFLIHFSFALFPFNLYSKLLSLRKFSYPHSHAHTHKRKIKNKKKKEKKSARTNSIWETNKKPTTTTTKSRENEWNYIQNRWDRKREEDGKKVELMW